MDDDEPDLQEPQLSLPEREFAQRETHHRQVIRENRIAAAVSLVAVLISAYAIVNTLDNNEQQLRQSTVQYETSTRDDHYNQIISGLDSEAAAVQANSMRLLTEFVEQRENYESQDEQEKGITNAVQILTAFIEDNSTVPGRPGLANYQSPVPIILSRAMARLEALLEAKDLGTYRADISRANLHGISLRDFEPRGPLLAIATDFRRASLTDLDLRPADAELTAAFFTCADLTGAELGRANVNNADFSGAILSGADLSGVKDLESEQLQGAVLDDDTELPEGVQPPTSWGEDRGERCFYLVNDMTGMRGGQGYSDVLPCPRTLEAARRVEFEPVFAGELSDLAQACRMRYAAE